MFFCVCISRRIFHIYIFTKEWSSIILFISKGAEKNLKISGVVGQYKKKKPPWCATYTQKKSSKVCNMYSTFDLSLLYQKSDKIRTIFFRKMASTKKKPFQWFLSKINMFFKKKKNMKTWKQVQNNRWEISYVTKFSCIIIFILKKKRLFFTTQACIQSMNHFFLLDFILHFFYWVTKQ